ncbi:MAG: 23S rRNA (guanosine(2251)-2'-O)-methyltransferase RlmB [Cyanobium sp.]
MAARGPEGAGGGRFLARGAGRPRPPAELVGLQRRQGPPSPRPAEPQDGEHYAGAAPNDLIWGRHSAQAALESGRPIHRIWCTPEMRFSPRFLQLLREAKAGGVLVEEVTWARLGQISGGAVHQGIVLQPAAAETLDLGSLIEGCRGTGEAPLLIAVDGLTDPQNLGAIVRSAEALGAHGLVLPQRRNAGLTGSVAKVAAGALEHLPVARVVNINRSLETLKDEGYRVIGLASEGSLTLEEADLEGPLVVVTGSEGDGLSLLTRRHCDQLVRIPLRGTTPSLNASVATALLLYEIARRGWMQGLRGTSPAPRLVRPALPAPVVASEDPAGTASQPVAEGPAPVAQQPATAAVQESLDIPGPPPHTADAAEAAMWHAAIAADTSPPVSTEPVAVPGSDGAAILQELPVTSADSGFLSAPLETPSEERQGALPSIPLPAAADGDMEGGGHDLSEPPAVAIAEDSGGMVNPAPAGWDFESDIRL